MITILVASFQYNAYETRKAYYACLQLSEKLAQQQNNQMVAYELYRYHIAETKAIDDK